VRELRPKGGENLSAGRPGRLKIVFLHLFILSILLILSTKLFGPFSFKEGIRHVGRRQSTGFTGFNGFLIACRKPAIKDIHQKKWYSSFLCRLVARQTFSLRGASRPFAGQNLIFFSLHHLYKALHLKIDMRGEQIEMAINVEEGRFDTAGSFGDHYVRRRNGQAGSSQAKGHL
jgi:hypothetical protein